MRFWTTRGSRAALKTPPARWSPSNSRTLCVTASRTSDRATTSCPRSDLGSSLRLQRLCPPCPLPSSPSTLSSTSERGGRPRIERRCRESAESLARGRLSRMKTFTSGVRRRMRRRACVILKRSFREERRRRNIKVSEEIVSEEGWTGLGGRELKQIDKYVSKCEVWCDSTFLLTDQRWLHLWLIGKNQFNHFVNNY